jgi:CubicO group peptidase (beta-lactamase class C family)
MIYRHHQLRVPRPLLLLVTIGTIITTLALTPALCQDNTGTGAGANMRPSSSTLPPNVLRAFEGNRADLATAAATPAKAEQPSNGLAPEVVDLSPKSISWAEEAKLPDLEKPYVSAAPTDLNDGIAVGKPTDAVPLLSFAAEIASGQHGDIDSLLIAHRGQLLFESYYRRGRINYPHYQMSITKSYTAMAIGRAIQLGHLTMADLDKPVIGFLKQLDRSKLVPGAEGITLAQAMNMRSGVRLDDTQAKELIKQPAALKGQGQIQAYLENSAPIPNPPREFKYQESDPSMTMQVLEAVVPGGARDFITKELFGKMGITNFAWENDVSGLPKAAAGCGLRSRDMLKWGMLVLNGGRWNGGQLIPKEFIDKATDRIYTNPQNTSYGFFWWRQNISVGGHTYDQKSGRGAGGQFIQMYPELDLIIVITAHEKAMGKMLLDAPARIIPTFVAN